jgi:tRNA A-37 threonylcarbamoyl transferase component Bud32
MDTPQRIGPYRVVRFIAEGGFAWVFEVIDEKLQARRALKMLRPEVAIGHDFERFKQEAQKLAQITSPYLVQVYDFGVDEASGSPYFTMNLVDGGNLRERLDEHLDQGAPGGLPHAEVIRIFKQALSGLARVHQADIVHRDIKPSNILLMRDGHAMLSDLGIARSRDSAGTAQLTATNVVLGTPRYMSPEQAAGRKVEPQSDVFSMGLALYEALTGRHVYDNVQDLATTSSSNEILFYLGRLEATGKQLPLPFDKTLKIPEPLKRVVSGACRYEPFERYDDAGAMLDALERAEHEIAHGPSGVPGWVLYAAAGVLGVALLAAGFFFMQRQGEARELEARLATVREAHERARTVAAALEGGDPGLPEAAARRIAGAAAALERAGPLVEAFERSWATDVLDGAERDLGEACRILRETLEPRYESDLATLGGLLTGLGASFPQTPPTAKLRELRDRFRSLSATSERLREPVDGSALCADTQQLQARRLELASALTLGQGLGEEVDDAWQLAAGRGREEARGAEQVARADAVKIPEYEAALASGAERLAEGEQLFQAEGGRAAWQAYDEAIDHFEQARAIVPAARARAEARRLEAEVPSEQLEGSAALALREPAAAAWQGGDWPAAATQYAAYSEGLRELIAGKDAFELARLALDEARAGRGQAEEARAASAAPDAWSEALARFGDADAAFDEQRYDAARRLAREAAEGFERARERAIEVVTRAGAAVADVARETGTKCGDAASSRAEACGRVEALLGEARAALEARDYARASEQAGRAQALLEAIVLPIRIASRSPEAGEVRIRRDVPLTFSVKAENPSGGSLRYAWSVNGAPLDVEGPRLQLRPTKGGHVEVRVQSGDQASTAAWDLVLNEPPSLTVSPAGTSRLRTGEELVFEADARDPDGDSVEIEWRLEGERAGSGTRYAFRASRPGTYVVSARAKDGPGDTALASRTVEVEGSVVSRAERPAAGRPSSPAGAPAALPLSLSIRGDDTPLAPGAPREFEAELRGGQAGETPEVAWQVDGRPAGTGRTFVFRPDGPGDYRVEARAGSARDTVEVSVAGGPPAEILQTVSRYGAAMRSCDPDQLRRTTLTKQSKLDLYWKLWCGPAPCGGFSRYDILAPEVRDVGDESAEVAFIVNLQCQSGRGSTTKMRATLTPRSGGEWVMVDLPQRDR